MKIKEKHINAYNAFSQSVDGFTHGEILYVIGAFLVVMTEELPIKQKEKIADWLKETIVYGETAKKIDPVN